MEKNLTKEINDFFVDIFNTILSREERIFDNSIYKDISIKEAHVIEAISLLRDEEKNTMTNIANKLKISVGALTTAIKTLVKKGYVERIGCTNDHRIVNIVLTSKGEEVNKMHNNFHDELIDCITKTHSVQEIQQLMECLNTFRNYLNRY